MKTYCYLEIDNDGNHEDKLLNVSLGVKYIFSQTLLNFIVMILGHY